MKTYKKAVSLVLGAGMMLAVGACGKESVPTTESESTTASSVTVTSEETTTSSEETTETEEYAAYSFGDAMGFQNCYCTCEMIAPHSYEWTMFNEDGEPIAYQFGGNDEFPRFYPVDMDGDGQDEIISYSQYSADGICQVDIFRNNDGVVEIGRYTDSRNVRGTTEYVYDTGEIIFHNWEKGTDEYLGIDDFDFEEYVYDN